MSSSTLGSCGGCDHAAGKDDCATCKLAFLAERKESVKRKCDENDIEEDDYSISEKLTENKNDHSILYLVLAALCTFGLVVLFTMLLKAL